MIRMFAGHNTEHPPGTARTPRVYNESRLLDHEMREFVNDLTNIAMLYWDTQHLRAKISEAIHCRYIKPQPYTNQVA